MAEDTKTKNSNIIWLLLLLGGAYLIWNRSKKGGIAKRQAQKKSGGALGGGGGGSSASPSGISDTLIAGLDDGTDININVETDTESGEGDINNGGGQGGGLVDGNIDIQDNLEPIGSVGEVHDDSEVAPDDNNQTNIDDSSLDVEVAPSMQNGGASLMEQTEGATAGVTQETSPQQDTSTTPRPTATAQAGFVGFVDFQGDEDDLDIDY